MGSSEEGLCTEHAINILTREIETVLKQFKHSRKHKSWVKETLHHSSKHTTLNWIALCLLIWSAASLALSHVVGPQNYGNAYVCEAVIVVLLVVLSLVSELYDNYVRHYEITRRTEAVVEKLKSVASKVEWAEENYPSLLIPFTPCITLQWTYRDGKLVNLPWSLLVKDDIIMVRPGQQSPGYCESLDKSSENHLLHAREVFAPHLIEPDDKNLISHPKIRKPLKGCKYKLLETPYLNNLRIMLEQSLLRPVTHQNQQRHYLLVEIVQRIMLPIVLALFFGVSLYKHFYLGIGHPVRLFLLAPTEGLLPLLPIVFPLLWNLANYIGMAKFQAIFNETKNDAKKESVTLEEDTDHVTEEDDFLKYSKKKMFFNFLSILKGEPEIMARSSNILHVLGSVTALCCVDKKGVLSWPNPTAEKVFFLHNNEDLSSSSSLSNVGEIEHDNYSGTPLRKMPQSPGRGATVEVLDLTHNHHDPFKLHFDDHDWDKHISSLKPLGLAILLNTCNMDTQKQYMQFCSHITCESMQSENLVPVTNRRCLCELAKEIGFSEYAQKIFSLEQQLSTFRHLQPELARRDNKYARSLQLLNSRLKFPFPHMFAVVVREVGTGAMQLLSEGTADILLDSCVDYWDGKDLTPLTQSDRKKIQDFYQRTSLTAYCTAFAYRPLSRTTTPNVAECYLELPSDSKHLYLGRSPTPIHNWDRGILEPRTAPLSLFYSTDSLLHPIDFAPEENVGDADGCFNIQCNQVFIGMVSMQYQALTDMVHLIEQLERACIRFVHFSKENELRSRVFSEKMGLESGWNCHISLLSERTSNLENARAMSFSAPSAINMEQSVVRFDTIVTNKSCSDQSSLHEPEDSKENTPETQELINHASHDWQSLSCLTDSTDQSAPIHFDMSNRAKLPRGIDKIRPHIELIDNVPLLVSLFTDCTSCATREMLQIMQDYGEIVCIFGSAANNENVGIFMQADASIAVEPLYPQVCQKKSVFSPTTKCISPVELARDLNSLASSLSLKREDPTSFFHLIMVARHYVITLWSAVQFWVCCAGLITGVQLVCTLALLPPPLSTGQVLWLVCVVVPLLSASLLALPVDPEVMKIPLGKNHLKVNLKMLIFIIWCYGFKFLPTVLTILVSFGAILTAHCSTLCSSLNCTCLFFHTPLAENRDGLFKMDGWIEDTWSITISRHFMLLIIVLHLCFISMSFVHREHLLFQRSPHKNMTWLVTTLVLILLQSFYTVLNYHLIRSDFEDTENFVVPNWVIIFGSLSPIFAAIIIELVKYQEIGVNRRFQRRARLDFGTKLGMNSPF